MGFWLFTFLSNLLIPLLMIFFGNYFIKKGPHKINLLFGYRTSMSMKNKDTWHFAHKYFGKLWALLGWALLFITIIAMFFIIHSSDNLMKKIGLMLMSIQILGLIGSIIPTEIALKKTFDKKGCRRE